MSHSPTGPGEDKCLCTSLSSTSRGEESKQMFFLCYVHFPFTYMVSSCVTSSFPSFHVFIFLACCPSLCLCPVCRCYICVMCRCVQVFFLICQLCGLSIVLPFSDVLPVLCQFSFLVQVFFLQHVCCPTVCRCFLSIVSIDLLCAGVHCLSCPLTWCVQVVIVYHVH